MTQPLLSESLPFSRTYQTCQGCGGVAQETWQETNEHNTPILKFVRLCIACVEKYVTPHERMYVFRREWQTAPGAMLTCCDCAYQHGIDCKSPMRSKYGGSGLRLLETKKFKGMTKHRAKRVFVDPINPAPPELPICGSKKPRI